MTEYLSAQSFLNTAFGVEDFTVPGLGMVQIRALSRTETLNLKIRHQEEGKPFTETELHILALAVLQPKLSVEEWREICDKTPGGIIEPLSDRIGVISGLVKGKETAKAAIKSA